MMSSQIVKKFICQIGITVGLLSVLPYEIAHSAPSPNQTQTSSNSNQAAIEDEQKIYYIAEKLIRANGLDDYPWRIKVAEEYEDDAYGDTSTLL